MATAGRLGAAPPLVVGDVEAGPGVDIMSEIDVNVEKIEELGLSGDRRYPSSTIQATGVFLQAKGTASESLYTACKYDTTTVLFTGGGPEE